MHPNWTDYASGSQGKPAADAAIIITKEAIGKKLGWLDYSLPPPDLIAAAVSKHSAGKSGITASTATASSQFNISVENASRAVSAAAGAAANCAITTVAGLGPRLALINSSAAWQGNSSSTQAGSAASSANSSSSTGPATPQQQQQQQQQQGVLEGLTDVLQTNGKPPSPELMSQLASSAGLVLHVVGYPDNQPYGSMWEQCCSGLDWQLQVLLVCVKACVQDPTNSPGHIRGQDLNHSLHMNQCWY